MILPCTADQSTVPGHELLLEKLGQGQTEAKQKDFLVINVPGRYSRAQIPSAGTSVDADTGK